VRNLHLSGNSPFFLASFLKSFAELTFVTGLPFYAIHLGAGPMELGIVGAAGMGVYTLSCLAISRWVDRLPPKMLAVASLVLASFNAVSVFMVDSVYSLVLVAGINGFLSGGYWPPVMTYQPTVRRYRSHSPTRLFQPVMVYRRPDRDCSDRVSV